MTRNLDRKKKLLSVKKSLLGSLFRQNQTKEPDQVKISAESLYMENHKKFNIMLETEEIQMLQRIKLDEAD